MPWAAVADAAGHGTSFMSARTFLDTNVLVYRFDTDEPDKRERSRQVFEQEGIAGRLVLSTQVLQELYVSLTRKLARPLTEEDAFEAVQRLLAFPVVQVDPGLVTVAMIFSREHRVSSWDALIIQAALQAGCDTLLSEDLQHGWKIDGLTIVNPFRTPAEGPSNASSASGAGPPA